MGSKVNPYALTTLERQKRILGIPEDNSNHDAQIHGIINGVTATVEGPLLGRHLLQREYVCDGGANNLSRLDGTGYPTLWLPNPPVVSISVLRPVPGSAALVEGPSADFTLHRGTGSVRLRNGIFEDLPGIVEVTYVGGYLTDEDTYSEALLHEYGWEYAAADLRENVDRVCAWIFRQVNEKRDGILSRSSGNSTATLADNWPKDIREQIEAYALDRIRIL